MKYLHLIWAALFRRKTRTLLTLVSIIAAFLLFGLLNSVRMAFSAGDSVDGAGRLIVNSRMSMQQALPESLGARIATVPGVSEVASANWFGGVYQDPRNQVISFILSVLILLFFILCGYNPVTDLMSRWASPELVQVVASFSVMTHFEAFQRGILDFRDVVFFASLIGFALFTTGVIIRGLRAG